MNGKIPKSQRELISYAYSTVGPIANELYASDFGVGRHIVGDPQLQSGVVRRSCVRLA